MTQTKRWLAALPVSAVLLGLVGLAASVRQTTAVWVASPTGMFCLLLGAAGIGYACLHVIAPQRRTAVWPLALALLAAAALGALLGQAEFLHDLGSEFAVAYTAEAVIAAATGLGLAGLARHVSRSLPDTPGTTYD